MLKLYNTLSRSVEPFEPLDPHDVRLYACGPTVYDYPHIGNLRFNVWVDVLCRTLEWLGLPVRLVMNITDVDDKTIAGARRTGQSLADYTAEFIDGFYSDLDAVRVRRAWLYPRATEHIDDMVALVESLIERRHAYEQDGSVYFRVSSFPSYGRLARLDPSQLKSTGRVEGDEYEKEDVRDFALWKAAREDEPAWDTSLGRGRPGWHLECSAMSMRYLGETFDIHAGGVDLVFPHHENEIAQSEGASGEPFARFWMHCAHLIVDGVKMSKSLGNQYTLRDLDDRGHDPVALRYLLASVHYRKQLNFTWDALAQAEAAVERIAGIVARLERELSTLPEEPTPDAPESAPGGGEPLGAVFAQARQDFRAALEEDLNTSGALGHLFTLIRETHTALDEGRADKEQAAAVLEWIRGVDAIWATLPVTEELVEREIEVGGGVQVAAGPRLAEDLLDLVVARLKARAARDFDEADRLRNELAERGIELEDTPNGVRWRKRS